MTTIWRILTRKKIIDPGTAEETSLMRIMNTFDLTALGVGSTLGVGVYVLAGHVARDTAGPAVILSFLIAAVASVLAGLCYAEFGARVPRAGSAYIYSYVCIGEFVAFVIGWNLILEYVIGSASVARGLSLYLDSLMNNTMQNAFIDILPINIPFLSKYFDFFAFGISVILAVALAFGLKESSLANNIFTILNIGVVLFVVIAGSFKANPDNWAFKPNNTNSTSFGNGGFFPFGVEGMIKGAATCFYGFVGFDCIATTGEEVKNPKKAIPIAIILSLFIIFLAYFGTATVITLMVPYYRQDRDAPIPFAFEDVHWYWAKWIVSIGGIFGLCASLFGAMFPLPRIIYAMANDNLVFKFLGKVNARFQTPVIGTLLAGLLTGLMGAIFDLKHLVNMMSIGTLLAYTIVAASVLLLRYTDNKIVTMADGGQSSEDTVLLSYESNGSILGQFFNCGRMLEPTKISEIIVTLDVFLYCVACIFIGLCAMYLKEPISNGEIWAIVITSIAVSIAAILIMSLVTQPTSKVELSFKVPMVPLIPALSILTNIYLMLMLDSHTWIRFGVWMIIGIPIYSFSVRKYTEARKMSQSMIDTQEVKFEYTNGFYNHFTNLGFQDDIGINGIQKNQSFCALKAEEKSENVEIQEELKKLDAMLEEVEENILDNTSECKLSVKTVSVASNVIPYEENVVAVVHCYNASSPAVPTVPPPDNMNLESEDIKINAPIYKISETIMEDSDLPLNVFSTIESQNTNLKSATTDPDTVINSQQTYNDHISGWIDNQNLASQETLEVIDQDNLTAVVTPTAPPVNSALLQVETDSNTLSRAPLLRPTSENLMNVTLRKIKNIERSKSALDEADDDNLKVGSEKYKLFMENLNAKLNSMTITPSYYYPNINNKAFQEPTTKELIVNEDVIIENINPKQAKEKLGAFINTLMENTNKNNEIPIDDNNEGKLHNKTNLDVETDLSLKGDDNSSLHPENTEITVEDNSNEDYETHKNRMQIVFRSINLKHLEPLNKSNVNGRKNSKTIGFLSDDKIKHKRAMSDIFKSIESRTENSKNS